MPAAKTEAPSLPQIRHEPWCRPTGDRDEIRIEQFVAYKDGPSGRAEASLLATRCLECGETRYDALP